MRARKVEEGLKPIKSIEGQLPQKAVENIKTAYGINSSDITIVDFFERGNKIYILVDPGELSKYNVFIYPPTEGVTEMGYLYSITKDSHYWAEWNQDFKRIYYKVDEGLKPIKSNYLIDQVPGLSEDILERLLKQWGIIDFKLLDFYKNEATGIYKLLCEITDSNGVIEYDISSFDPKNKKIIDHEFLSLDRLKNFIGFYKFERFTGQNKYLLDEGLKPRKNKAIQIPGFIRALNKNNHSNLEYATVLDFTKSNNWYFVLCEIRQHADINDVRYEVVHYNKEKRRINNRQSFNNLDDAKKILYSLNITNEGLMPRKSLISQVPGLSSKIIDRELFKYTNLTDHNLIDFYYDNARSVYKLLVYTPDADHEYYFILNFDNYKREINFSNVITRGRHIKHHADELKNFSRFMKENKGLFEGLMPKKSRINPNVEEDDIVFIKSLNSYDHEPWARELVGSEAKVLAVDEDTIFGSTEIYVEAKDLQRIFLYPKRGDTFIKIN